MSDVTQILNAVVAGDRQAASQLLPFVYEELRKLAAVRMASEAPAQSLNATALVHEAYLRLVGSAGSDGWQGRGHFFAAAAESMRRILVERARSRKTLKHGCQLVRVDLDSEAIAVPERDDDLVALDEALDRLATFEPQAVQLVQLRYFAGCTMAECADLLGISLRTSERLWAYAKAWLLDELRPDSENSSG